MRDSKRAISLLRQLRATAISRARKHDVQFTDQASADMWKVFASPRSEEVNHLNDKFNNLLQFLQSGGLDCASLLIKSGETAAD